jgi:hypothetical protein
MPAKVARLLCRKSTRHQFHILFSIIQPSMQQKRMTRMNVSEAFYNTLKKLRKSCRKNPQILSTSK